MQCAAQTGIAPPAAVARKAPNPATDAKMFPRSRPSGVVEPMCNSLAEKRSMTVVQHRLGPGPLDVRDRDDPRGPGVQETRAQSGTPSHLPNRVCYAPAIGCARMFRKLRQFRIFGA